MENTELTARIGKALKSGQSVLGVAALDEYKHLLAEWVSLFVPQAEEGSPRAIIIASSEQEAREIHELISTGTRSLDLTVDLVTEKGKKLQQRNDLFDGTEIIVGTARRICQMYFQNGFNVSKLRLFAVLEMDSQMRQGLKGYILRLAESLPKCKQLLLSKNGDETRIQEYIEEAIPNIQVIE
ncbi:MAG: DEAD/DEAH box helicase [Crocinitomicaceae bacterium]|jgi:superfamily II DNA/RNA helicase|nr:DEAD/DEAH box helicase [Crocinitomicaceae bacterium]MCF8443384.1 DEAD/DEAH box helicase [Crocinitomicaceae bacterium]